MFLHIFVIVMFFLGQWPMPMALAETTTIVLNELMWMGSSSSTADEWIELRNLTDQPIELGGWRITKLSSGVETTMLTIPAGLSITPGGFFLISNYAETAATSSLAVTPNLVTTDVALANSAVQVKLYDASNQLQDTADDGVGNPLSGTYSSSDKIFRSMERNPFSGDGTVAQSWHSASRALGWKEGKSEWGTPGTTNSNGMPIAVAGPDQDGVVGQEINFDGSDSIDPEGLPLTYVWNFGDGITGAEVTPRHTYTTSGKYIVQLTVSDGVDQAQDVVEINIAPVVTGAMPTSAIHVPVAPSSPSPTTSCDGAVISEIFPNPIGVDNDEFLELYNPTKHTLHLNSCTIWLNEKRKAVLPDVLVAAHHYVRLEKSVTKISLTNVGGRVQLLDTNGAILGTVEYPKAPENESWSVFGTEWLWTNQVTPGKKNLRPIDDESETSSTKKDNEQPQSVGLDDIQTLDSGTVVVVRGVVTVAPNLLGTRVIFLQSESGAVSAVLPEKAIAVSVGDEVEFTGKVRLSQGRKRVGVNGDGARVVQRNQPIQSQTITLDQLSPELADRLVTISGLISNSTGSKWLIDDGTAEAEIYVKTSTGIIKPRSASGDRLFITGIVSVTTAGVRVLPRTIDDLRVERVLGTATEKVPTKVILPTSSPQQSVWYWVFVAAGGFVVAAKPIWKFFRTRKNPPSDGRIEV